MAADDNRLVLSGHVAGRVERRETPAGIPITRFTVEHVSRQSEAGMAREVRCRLAVVAAGAGFDADLAGLGDGEPVRITGFLARAGYRHEEHRLVLHAQRVERLNRGY